MLENFFFLVIFDTCDVVHNWFIYLLPPNVPDIFLNLTNFFNWFQISFGLSEGCA